MTKEIKLNFILMLVCFLGSAQVIYSQNLDSLFSVGEYAKILKHFETSPPSNFQDKILEAKSLKAKHFYQKAIASYHKALIDRTDEPVHLNSTYPIKTYFVFHGTRSSLIFLDFTLGEG